MNHQLKFSMLFACVLFVSTSAYAVNAKQAGKMTKSLNGKKDGMSQAAAASVSTPKETPPTPAPVLPVQTGPTPSTHGIRGYVGMSVGYGTTRFIMRAQQSSGNFNASRFQADGALFSLQTGMNYRSNAFLVGLEFMGQLDTTGTTTFSQQLTPVESTRIRHPYSYGIALRVGGYVSDTAMVYLRFGLERHRWQLRYKINATEKNDAKTAIVFAPGFGMEAMMARNLSLRTEFKYVFPTTTTTNVPSVATGAALNNSIVKTKLTQAQVNVGLNYLF